MDDNQQTRFSQKDLELLRATFGNDSKVLFALRDFMFQFTDEVPKFIPEVLAVIEKIFLPKLDKDIPINFQKDLYSSAAAVSQVLPEVAHLHIKARDVVVDYLTQHLFILGGGQMNRISLESLKRTALDDKQRLVDMLAYQFLTNNWIDSCIADIQLKSRPEETPEEAKKRLKANSAK